MSMPVRSFLMRAPRIEPRLERGPEPAASSQVLERAQHPGGPRPATPRRTPVRTGNRIARGHISRRCVHPGSGSRRPHEPGATDGDARQFAEYAIRLVLDVLNQKRVPAILAPVLDSGPVSMVRSLCRGSVPMPGKALGPARAPRVAVRRANTDQVEFFGSYLRGKRQFAVAGRLTRKPHLGWRVTALQLA